MLGSLFNYAKQHRFILVTLILWAFTQLVVIPSVTTPVNTVVLGIVATVPVAYLLVFGTQCNHYKAFVAASVYGIPMLVIATALLFVINPSASDWLGHEDFVIENMTAGAALLASVVMLIVGLSFAASRQFLRAVVAGMLAAAFFIIGMEEISWMQRVLSVESNEFFLTHNVQAETNFHNLNTSLTMAAFFILVFVMFIVVPFFKEQISNALDKIKLSQAALFIPSSWLVLPFFTALFGFASSSAIFQPYYVIMLTFSTTVLVYYIAVEIPAAIQNLRHSVQLTITATIIAMLVVQMIDYEGLGLRTWFPTEYREFFICFGIFIYAVDVAFRTFQNQETLSSSSKTRSQAQASRIK